MTDQVKYFVATYKPKPTPEPFFGFFKVGEYKAKKVYKTPDLKNVPLYIQVMQLHKMKYTRAEIAIKLGKTRACIKCAINYYYRHYE